MLTIRNAKSTDNEAISRVHQAAIRGCVSHYEPPQLEAWAARQTPEFYARVLAHQELFVAERNGAVIAFGWVDLEGGNVHSVYVAPEASGAGVGSAMLQHLENLARQLGWSQVTLIATLNAVPFCEKRGYDQVGPFNLRTSGANQIACVEMRKKLA